jgi:hypothetical protein
MKYISLQLHIGFCLSQYPREHVTIKQISLNGGFIVLANVMVDFILMPVSMWGSAKDLFVFNTLTHHYIYDLIG